jgi:hypothetical protein
MSGPKHLLVDEFAHVPEGQLLRRLRREARFVATRECAHMTAI